MNQPKQNPTSITRETFQDMTTESKLNILFDYIQTISINVETLEKRKRWDKVSSFIGGVFGGAGIVFSKSILWK